MQERLGDFGGKGEGSLGMGRAGSCRGGERSGIAVVSVEGRGQGIINVGVGGGQQYCRGRWGEDRGLQGWVGVKRFQDCRDGMGRPGNCRGVCAWRGRGLGRIHMQSRRIESPR